MSSPPRSKATRVWFSISLQAFGPPGQIAVMQRAFVDEKRRINQQRLLFALSYCNLLPGPEAQQSQVLGGSVRGTSTAAAVDASI